MAGYSGKPLGEKLGVKPGLKLYVDRQTDAGPVDLDLGAPYATRLPKQVDLTLVFCTQRTRLDRRLPTLIERTPPNGMIWVCWPKKSSGRATDLTENDVRAIGLAAGVVDVKVAAIDETWSGLKFVRRLKDR
jgi:hypothetical protein